jgi:hypothetical protein
MAQTRASREVSTKLQSQAFAEDASAADLQRKQQAFEGRSVEEAFALSTGSATRNGAAGTGKEQAASSAPIAAPHHRAAYQHFMIAGPHARTVR